MIWGAGHDILRQPINNFCQLSLFCCIAQYIVKRGLRLDAYVRACSTRSLELPDHFNDIDNLCHVVTIRGSKALYHLFFIDHLIVNDGSLHLTNKIHW